MKNNCKMSYKKLRSVLLPGMAFLMALVITLTVGMLSSSASLDSFFGRGKRTITTLSESDSLDTNYYTQLYANKMDSRDAATEVAKHISDEGIVLLKNDGLLPLSSTATVSPFGLRYFAPYYGGTGSSAIDIGEDYIVTPQESLHSVFRSVNPVLEEKLYQAGNASQQLTDNPNVIATLPLYSTDASAAILEFSPGVYNGVEASCRDTAGIVFIGRQTGENCDAYSDLYDDGTPHMLALSMAERAAIDFAKANCSGVVIVLECSSPMQIAELEDDIDIGAILWLGGTGCSGYQSLGDILIGTVVPSGRTPGLYPVNLQLDPAFMNHDDGSTDFVYNNAYTTLVDNISSEEYTNAPFHEYEEGVYLGYKYYETAYDIGYLTDYYNRYDGVLYPFGYGLSYTAFSQEIVSSFDQGDKIVITVRVENTGRHYAGKDVVQIYYTAPYTDFDRDYNIEKPTAVLIQFKKTGLIEPGAYEDITVSLLKEEMASYCYTRNNGDGTIGCYVLEEGDYTISIRANSHIILDTCNIEIPVTVWYDNHNPRQTEVAAQADMSPSGALLDYPAKNAVGVQVYQAATNQFEQLRNYMTDPTVSNATILSRKDWSGTLPTAPTEVDRTASATVIRWFAESDSTKYDYENDLKLGNDSGSAIFQNKMPATGADNGIVLADLRGKTYYDSMWNLLLDQLTMTDMEEIRLCLFEAAYKTGAINAIGKPASIEHDGPQGLAQLDQSGRNFLSGTCGYPSAPVMAATWNKTLMYKFGCMVGQEAMLTGTNGWYAPGLNTHRSPFGGRVAEYFSEDGVLAGYLGAQVISGAGDAGLFCAVKHLVLMETEGHRNPHTSVWLSEQALREIYLKPFELALKNARKTIRYIGDKTEEIKTRTMRAGDCIMTGDCAVGTYWTATNYELLTQVVRGEWGFQGFILSDMNLNSNSNRVDMMLRSGCDALMSTSYGEKANAQDFASATGVMCLRNAIKNICYSTVNSNLMQGAAPGSTIHYAISPWKVWLIVGDITAGVPVLVGVVWLWLRRREEKSN